MGDVDPRQLLPSDDLAAWEALGARVVRPDRFVAASAGDPAGTAPPTPGRPALNLIDAEEAAQ